MSGLIVSILLKKNSHKWIIKNKLKNIQITFDGKIFTLGTYFENMFYILERVKKSIS